MLYLDPSNGSNSFSFGSTNQTVRFGGKSAQGELGMEPDIELYFRNVGAVNGTLRSDVERLVSKGVARNGNGVVEGNVTAIVDDEMVTGVGRMQLPMMRGWV